MPKNYGFVPDIITSDQWFSGKLPRGQGVRLDGQWEEFLPKKERQRKNGVETLNCSNYGTLNALETLHKAKYGSEPNWSERFLGVVSGTSNRGNSPHKVAEAIRAYGLIPEQMLPFDDSINSWDKYYSPKPMTDEYLEVGQHWLENYKFNHAWINVNKNVVMDELKYSPLGMGVYAWVKRNGKYYRPDGYGSNHWVTLIGYKKGEYWKIFDSYDSFVKLLEWSYPFDFIKSYRLNKKSMAKVYRKRDREEIIFKLGEDWYWAKTARDFNNVGTEIPWVDWGNQEVVDEFPEEAKKQKVKIIGSSDFEDTLNKYLGRGPEMKGRK